MKINNIKLSTYDIIDGMTDWIRVIDKNDNIIFANRAMCEGLSKDITGMKCFNAIGKAEPCENCTSRCAVFDGISHSKEEVIGDRIFSVKSSPVRSEFGETFAVVEVLRDITEMRSLQIKILDQNRKLQRDVESAKLLQSRLLPNNFKHNGINFSYTYLPCDNLGGDFIDIFSIDDDHIGLYIADVSGHGLPASMLTVFLYSTIDKTSLSPSHALSNLFTEFAKNSFKEDYYITVFYAILNLKTKTLTFSNAGHNVCPIAFSKDKLEILRSPGFPISNWADSPGYTDRKLCLEKGDRIFFYTDGIVEIRNTKDQQFGEERLLDILSNNKGTPKEVLDILLKSFKTFTGSQKTTFCDDITIAILEIK